MLRRHAFVDGVVVLCANHAALAGRRPLTAAAFLEEVKPADSDRRGTMDRRRHLERRASSERRCDAEPVDLDARASDRRAS